VNDRSDELSTADLAGQQPGGSTRADRDVSDDTDDRDVVRDTHQDGRTDDAVGDRDRLDGPADDGPADDGPVRDDSVRDDSVRDDSVRDTTDQSFRDPAESSREPAPAASGPMGTSPGEPGPAGTGPAANEPAAAPAHEHGPLLPAGQTEGYRARWTDVQTGFVDAPRQAVEQADRLVAELMQHLATTFADERGRLEGQWDRGDDVPTDDLRTAFQRYRSFFERLLAT
jgi:hypothetical protein